LAPLLKLTSPSPPFHLQLRPEPFHLAYGTGRVVGSVATETLTIGTPPMAVKEQGFGMIVDTSADFARTSCDGLIVSFVFDSGRRRGAPTLNLAHLSQFSAPRPLIIIIIPAPPLSLPSNKPHTRHRPSISLSLTSTLPSSIQQGLGFSSLSVMKQPTLFDRMRGQGLLASPRFSVWMSDDPDQEPAGAITFGGVDPERYSGKMNSERE